MRIRPPTAHARVPAQQRTGGPSDLWRVQLEPIGHEPRQWEGYAWSSSDATMRALAWASEQLGPCKCRVREVLQVGV